MRRRNMNVDTAIPRHDRLSSTYPQEASRKYDTHDRESAVEDTLQRGKSYKRPSGPGPLSL